MDDDSDIGEPIVKRIKSDTPMGDNLCDNEQEKQLKVQKNSNENIDLIHHESRENIKPEENEGRRASPSVDGEDSDDSFEFPPDDDVTDMLEGVQYHGLFPTITDRYFTPYYKLNVQTHGDDIRILVHSNRICMLTLAPSHTVLRNDNKITKVDFKVSDKLDRSMNKVSGKSKHGAQPLQANSNICTITCSSGEHYTIKCCMIGKLVEVNEALIENPKILLEPPHRGGYLAIVLPNIKLLEKIKESLLTQEEYESAISQCKSISNNLEENEVAAVTLKTNVNETENNSQLMPCNNDQTTLSAAS